MRVIGGSARGRRLVVPTGLVTRPLTDRAREALFASLGWRVEAAAVLDLFAGSGALGIEALSRGAATATFVEKDRRALAALRRNLDATGFDARVVAGTVMSFLAGASDRYDLVFVDPPYAMSLASVEGILASLAPLVRNGGTVVVHRRTGGPAPQAPEGLDPAGSKRYGDAELWRFTKEERR